MAREAVANLRTRAARVFAAFDRAMPEAHIELDYRTPLELVVAVLLSAQTTDKRVNLVTPALFTDFRHASDYAAATPAQLEPYVKTVGLFRNKAKALVGLGKALMEHHAGVVPVKRALLSELPGVGLKTAGVVSMHLDGGDPSFPVDTHVFRLSHRLGFSRGATPDDVEHDLRRIVPTAGWFKAHQLLVWHGRRVCHARSPECHRCVAAIDCPKRGVARRSAA